MHATFTHGEHIVDIETIDEDKYVHDEWYQNDYSGHLIETWRRDGVLCRDDYPARIIRHIETGQTIYQEFLKNGKTHRVEGAAIITENDDVYKEAYYLDGEIHSENGEPCYTAICKHTQLIIGQAWAKNGEYHREGQPASFSRCPDTGIMEHESYMEYGLLHRDDGPAQIQRDPQTGVMIRENYYLKGALHREGSDLPAVIKRDGQSGVIIETIFYKMGNRISPFPAHDDPFIS